MTDAITVDPNTFAIAKGIDAAWRQGIEDAAESLPALVGHPAGQRGHGAWQDGWNSALETVSRNIRKLLDEQPVNLGDGLSTSQFVSVPVEPTPGMIEAGSDMIRDGYPISQVADGKAVDCYRAMIEARQA